MRTLFNFLKESKSEQEIFTIIKPGFLNLSQQIIKKFEDNKYEIKEMRTKRLLPSEAKLLYKIHEKEDFYEPLWKYMSSDITTAIIFKYNGDDDIFEKTSKLKNEIRKEYGESDMRNVLHSSDSLEHMDLESSIYFNKIGRC